MFYHYFTVYFDLIFLPRRKRNEMVKKIVDSEFMIGDWQCDEPDSNSSFALLWTNEISVI